MTNRTLNLGPDLRVPIELALDSWAILARRGGGKSFTAKRLAEEMARIEVPFVVLDPKGDWWGLRSSADGKSPGLPVTIFGGEHGDMPLEPQAGELIAHVIQENPGYYLLDLGAWSKSKRREFVVDFAEKLWELRHKRAEQWPMHLFIDEADQFVPQRVDAGLARMVGAIDVIVRQGRGRGIGDTLICQRTAVLNWDVLSQTENLLALQTTAAIDKKPVLDWFRDNVDAEVLQQIRAGLSTLPIGTAYFYSPRLTAGDKEKVRRVRIDLCETFDSGATPKIGEKPIVPKRLAQVDISAVAERMAEVVARAKAEDPKELRRQLATLKAELQATRAALESRPEAEAEPKIIEVPVFDAACLGGISELTSATGALLDVMRAGQQAWATALPALQNGIDRLTEQVTITAHAPALSSPRVPRTPASVPAPTPRPIPSGTPGTAQLGKAERSILTVLAQYPAGRTKTQVALLCGYSSKGGGFNNALSSLRTQGFMDGREQLSITAEGLDALGNSWEPLPTGPALVEWWQSKLGKAERLILGNLIERGPATKETVAEATGYEVKGGGFNNAVSRLVSLELILRTDGKLEAHPALSE